MKLHLIIKMDTIFTNSENSKTSEPYILILNLTDKLDLRRGEIEYSDNYSKISGSLWQYCKDIPAVNNNDDIVNFNGAMLLIHLILKQKQ